MGLEARSFYSCSQSQERVAVQSAATLSWLCFNIFECSYKIHKSILLSKGDSKDLDFLRISIF